MRDQSPFTCCLLNAVEVAWGSGVETDFSSVDKVISDKRDQEMYLVVCHCNYRRTSLSGLHLICFLPQRLHSSASPVCTSQMSLEIMAITCTLQDPATRVHMFIQRQQGYQILNRHFSQCFSHNLPPFFFSPPNSK